MMGIDLDRFPERVDEELICPICSCVLDAPVQASSCEHAFCKSCIEEWLKQRPICPVDRQPLFPSSLVPVPRILRNMLSRLNIYCRNRRHGCSTITTLESEQQHSRICVFDGERMIECIKGCGTLITKNQYDVFKQHNCLTDLRCSITALENRLDDCQQLISDQSMTIVTQQTRIDELEERMKIVLNIAKSMINENYRNHSIVDSISNNDSGEQYLTEIDSEELQIWACSLPEAIITRWGGMISTPDLGLQTSIRRALIECGCPSTCAELLIDRAHERRWPLGLATLDVRQSNRIRYENYFCRRIPGKQAVVIFSLDNLHMPREMVCSPGIIMIFAHGVESS